MAAPRTWGRLARRGAERVADPEAAVGGRVGSSPARGSSASSQWRAAVDAARPQGRDGSGPPRDAAATRDVEARDERRRRGLGSDPAERRDAPPPEPWEPEQWIDLDDLEGEATEAVARGRTRPRPARGGAAPDASAEPIEGSVRAELARAVRPSRVPRLEERLKEASRAFEAERYQEAARILKKLADEAPTAAAVRELYGLTLYRLGRWRPAAAELEAFRDLTGSTEQHPVLADCYRAQRRYDQVDELWAELREASPSAELVTEGRIVAAGARADQGDAAGAVRLLAQGFTFPKRPREHHLRRAYALADAYERAGDVGRARELFQRVADADPDFGDARRRARALR